MRRIRLLLAAMMVFSTFGVAEAQSLNNSKLMEGVVIGPPPDATASSKESTHVVINPDVLGVAKNMMFVVLVQTSGSRSIRSPLIQPR